MIFLPIFVNKTEANRHNTFQVRVISELVYTTTLLCGFGYYIAVEHNQLNVEREAKGVRGGFFLGVWIHVNSVANCNCCILRKVGYAATIRGREEREAKLSAVKLNLVLRTS